MREIERALKNVCALISEQREPWRDQWTSAVLDQTRELLEEALANYGSEVIEGRPE